MRSTGRGVPVWLRKKLWRRFRKVKILVRARDPFIIDMQSNSWARLLADVSALARPR